jgi:hypothetical protein
MNIMEKGDRSVLPVSSADQHSPRTSESPDRRETLAQLGRFAYAAPALALLAQPRGAQADYGGGGGIRDGSKGGGIKDGNGGGVRDGVGGGGKRFPDG